MMASASVASLRRLFRSVGTLYSHRRNPHFTTKGLENGTGLGLATVHSIISKLGGCIEVESSPGNGACFTIHLPSADPELEQALPSLEKSGKASHT
jgi:two-component system cell cycle sensor histidine kinase/response regulator CckA